MTTLGTLLHEGFDTRTIQASGTVSSMPLDLTYFHPWLIHTTQQVRIPACRGVRRNGQSAARSVLSNEGADAPQEDSDAHNSDRPQNRIRLGQRVHCIVTAISTQPPNRVRNERVTPWYRWGADTTSCSRRFSGVPFLFPAEIGRCMLPGRGRPTCPSEDLTMTDITRSSAGGEVLRLPGTAGYAC